MKPLIKNNLKIKRLLFLQNFGRDKHVFHECWIIRRLCRGHVYHVQNLVKVIKYFLLYITLWLLRLLSLSGNINSFCALNFTVNTTFKLVWVLFVCTQYKLVLQLNWWEGSWSLFRKSSMVPWVTFFVGKTYYLVHSLNLKTTSSIFKFIEVFNFFKYPRAYFIGI